MAAGNYNLLYFNIPGRGEIIRLVFHHLGKALDEKSITFEQWPEYKPNVELVPTGFIPVLTTPCGAKLSQSCSILRYLGNEFNLYGKTNVDKSKVDSVLDFIKEIFDAFVQIHYYTKEEEKAAKIEAMEKQAHIAFKYFEILVKQNKGNDFFVGNEPTIADIYFLEVVRALNTANKNNTFMTSYPLLKTLHDKTASTPNLKKYLDSRKF